MPAEATAHRYAYRAVRVDMKLCTPRVARQLCEQYDEVVRLTVGKLAKRTRKSQILDADDLLQIGRIALVEALLTFRDDRGMAFRSWASHVVLWRCQEALQAAVDPFDGGAMVGELRRARARGEIEEARFLEAMVHAEQAAAVQIVSLSAADPGERPLLDRVAAPGESPEDHVLAADMHQRLYSTLETLETREAMVLASDLRGESGANLGRQVGVTRQRISDHRKAARSRLRAVLGGSGVDARARV